ncbi:HU family DNA-binding protein [Paenibacillus sp. FSL E2-0178]|uniref:HU family DNA-binding protein n=1 Tax=Paenibacillus sp. FSL E2-0178 TaxID=2921361 RepID=UPI00315940B4
MNKQELITGVTTKTGLDKKDVTLVVENIFDTVSSTLAAGGKVGIFGFGTFETRVRKERPGFNPKTLKDLKEQGIDPETAKAQAAITIPASKTPAFKPASALKKTVN